MAVIALDLGGTKLASAIFNEDGEILHQSTTLLEFRKENEVGELIIQQVIALLSLASDLNKQITALGICVPGIAYRNGNVWAPNIEGWENYPLRKQLESSFPGISICIDSDRSCYILGETWKGNAVGCRDAIFLSIGTGIGAGILVNGEVLRGAHDIAGAIGWMALDRPFNDKYISCGCFEYNASGIGLGKVAQEMLASTNNAGSKYQWSDLASINAKVIFEAFDKGDPIAKDVIANAIECWGMAVANLISLFNPEKIILGGGVFGPALRFLDDIYSEAKKWAQPISMEQVTLQGSALGNDAGLYGAGQLALKDHKTN